MNMEYVTCTCCSKKFWCDNTKQSKEIIDRFGPLICAHCCLLHAEAVKKELIAASPIMVKMLENPTFVANANDAGYQFDAKAIFKAFSDAAGWTVTHGRIETMTDEDKQFLKDCGIESEMK